MPLAAGVIVAVYLSPEPDKPVTEPLLTERSLRSKPVIEVEKRTLTSNAPFCTVAGENEFTYAWHRYYTVTESIWFVTELHPV